jgi:hypothetical protein
VRPRIAKIVVAAGVAGALLLMPQGFAVTLPVGVNSDVTVNYGDNAAVVTVAPYEVEADQIDDYFQSPPPADDRINARCTLHAGPSAVYNAASNRYAIAGAGYINCEASDVRPTDISMNVQLLKNGSSIESGANACPAADHCAATTGSYSCSSTCSGTYQVSLTATITYALGLRRYPSRCSKIADNQLSCHLLSNALTIK